jgi:ornithine carbamoyltransferase
VIYTDVFVSMGEEAQAAEKTRRFAGYQVNKALLDAAPAECVVTHCLPAHPGEEISQEVMDSPRYVAFDEAENRLHAQKAVLLKLIG